MFRLAIFVLTFGILSSAQALMCNPGDSTVGSSFRVEYLACTTSGYCNAYGYNPATGRNEYFYGWHSSCQGQQERQVQELWCQTPEGAQYYLVDHGWWGSCQIR